MSFSFFNAREHKVQIEGEGGDEVDDVHRRLDELKFVVTDDEANDYLESEPGVAGTFYIKEGFVRLCPPFFQGPDGGVICTSGVHGDVLDDGHSHVGVCLEAER